MELKTIIAIALVVFIIGGLIFLKVRSRKKYPDQITRKDAHNFTVPKRCVSVREPYSAERRKAASERAKAAGYQPPVRKSSS